MYDKESIYDNQIYPLMDSIIKICKDNDIQMIASFTLKKIDDDGEDLLCSTYLESSEYNSNRLEDAIKVIQHGYIAQKPYFLATTITSR